MNPIYSTTKLGTLGELLVQLRLLQHDVQAAQPLKDSGNDLIAIRGHQLRAVQVRCTTTGYVNKPGKNVLYDILVVVHVDDPATWRGVAEANVYLFTRSEVAAIRGKVARYVDNLLSAVLITTLFAEAGPR